jgi:hypothetical protein
VGSASQEGDTTCGVACDGTRESLNCLPDGEDSGIEAGGKIETPQSTMRSPNLDALRRLEKLEAKGFGSHQRVYSP